MNTFGIEVISILQEKGYKQNCYPLQELSRIVETNSKLAKNKVFVYKWLGISLIILIGVLGVVLPFLVGLDSELKWKEVTVQTISVVLAISTIFNSMFKPNERFSKACRIGIEIEHYKVQLLLALEREPKLDDANLHRLVDDKLKEFEKYQEALIELFMPTQIPPAQRGASRRG